VVRAGDDCGAGGVRVLLRVSLKAALSLKSWAKSLS
jgi:hypothetical protein